MKKEIAMKKCILFIGLFLAGVNSLLAQAPDVLGTGTDGQLQISIYNSKYYPDSHYQNQPEKGTFGVIRDNIRQVYYPSDILCVKVGTQVYATMNDSYTRLTMTTGAVVNTGIDQYATKTFSGTYSGHPFSIEWTIRYNTTNPDFFTMSAVVDATQIPAGTPVSLAYGFDSFVNGCDKAAAFVLPDVNQQNGVYNHLAMATNLSDDEVRSLQLVGAKNEQSPGSFMGFFTMGRTFDRAASSDCSDSRPNQILERSPDENRFSFGIYTFDCSNSSGAWDNALGVAYDNIPAGTTTTINTGLTFTDELYGELSYSWTDDSQVNNTIAWVPGGIDVDLSLMYQSKSIANLTGVKFQVDLPPGLTQNGVSNHTPNFEDFIATDQVGGQNYTVSNATVSDLNAGLITVPVHVSSYGQYVIDGNAISNTRKTLPLGEPATLTVTTNVGFENTKEKKVLAGHDAAITLKLPAGVLAQGNLEVLIAPHTNTDNFEALPASVTIPDGENSISFVVHAKDAAVDGEHVDVTLLSTSDTSVNVTPDKARVSIGKTIVLPVNHITNNK
jgi:hypothetical protein